MRIDPWTEKDEIWYSDCHGSRVTVEKDHRVLVLILRRVDVRKG